MARNIFLVDSYLVDANGAFSHFSGFPQSFDSKNFENNVDTAMKRANSAFAAQVSKMNSAEGDSRQIQMVTLTDITGYQIDRKCVGTIVEPEPEPEPEEESAE